MDVYRNAAGGIPLVPNLIVDNAFFSPGTTGDRPLNVVLGDRVVFRLLDGGCQRVVGGEVATALARRGLNGSDKLGEELAARSVLSPFAVLDIRPFGMPGNLAHLHQQLVDSSVICQFGVKRCCKDTVLANKNWMFLTRVRIGHRGHYLNFYTHLVNPRGTDEDRMYRFGESRDGHVRLERLNLATESVALDNNV